MQEKAVLPRADFDLLARYDTPTVCNVIELFRIRPQTAGYMDSRIRACAPELPPMVGYASTATFRSGDPPRTGGVYGTLEEHVSRFDELPGPAVVVYQDLDDPPVAATFGEVMASVYKSFGAHGLITSGAGRDVEQVRELKFPCFCDGAICSHGYPHTLEFHVPVRVGGVTVYPGDLLHGDLNGVTTVPLEIASEVAHACGEFVEAESLVIDYCKAGKVTSKGLAEARAEMAGRLQTLGARLRGAAEGRAAGAGKSAAGRRPHTK